MKRKWFWAIPVGLLAIFFLATGTKVLAAGGSAELVKILEAGLGGLTAY